MAWRNWPAFWSGMGLSSSADPGFIHWFAPGKNERGLIRGPLVNQPNQHNQLPPI